MSLIERICGKAVVDKLLVIYFSRGFVAREICGYAERVTTEFYRRARSRRKLPGYVEVVLYPTTGEMVRSVLGEGVGVGASVYAVYTSMYEAWHGVPRIHIAADQYRDKDLFRALLVHEAAHSVLHPSIDYYLVSLPSLTPIAERAVSILASGYKDVEVYHFMLSLGYEREIALICDRFPPPRTCEDLESFLIVFKESIPFLVLGRRPKGVEEKCLEAVTKLYGLAVEVMEKRTVFSEAVSVLYRHAAELFSP